MPLLARAGAAHALSTLAATRYRSAADRPTDHRAQSLLRHIARRQDCAHTALHAHIGSLPRRSSVSDDGLAFRPSRRCSRPVKFAGPAARASPAAPPECSSRLEKDDIQARVLREIPPLPIPATSRFQHPSTGGESTARSLARSSGPRPSTQRVPELHLHPGSRHSSTFRLVLFHKRLQAASDTRSSVGNMYVHSLRRIALRI